MGHEERSPSSGAQLANNKGADGLRIRVVWSAPLLLAYWSVIVAKIETPLSLLFTEVEHDLVVISEDGFSHSEAHIKQK